jgi:putative transposase
VEQTLQQALEGEMEEALQAGKGERTTGRLGYRSGYYNRALITRVGKIELRVPQDRQGRFRTEVFERYQRSEKALVMAMIEMYIQGVSTRKVKAIAEEFCGHEFSSATISRIVQQLDQELEQFASRRLEEPYPYLVLDARYERIREGGTVRTQAVLVAVGINWDGRRSVLAVDLASRERAPSWKQLLLSSDNARCTESSLWSAMIIRVSDALSQEVLPEAAWQRCYVHFLRNALDYLPRKADDDCLQELRWIYDRRDGQEARQDLAAWLGKWSKRYAKLCAWVEDNIEETLSFYRLPRQHPKNMKSTNMLERLMEEIKRRTLVVRIFPNAASCLRLVRALAVELDENWIEAMQYLNMEPLAEQKKEAMRRMGDAA